MRKFLIITSFSDYFLNFRRALIIALQDKGLQIHVILPKLPSSSILRDEMKFLGINIHEISIDRISINPLSEIRTLINLWLLIRKIRPYYVFGYNIKPVIYGTLAAWLANVPKRYVIITGLGYVFQKDRNIFNKIVQYLYKLSLSKVDKVFFQNSDDRDLFRERNILSPNIEDCIVNGSGVDLDHFSATPAPIGEICFLLIGRLLGDKGVREYAEAARRIRKIYPKVRCLLVGWIDDNPSSIRAYELNNWVTEGWLEFLGRLSDVRPAIAQCSVFVLPSYREGTPRTTLEAMAMGRAIITTDAPGCRETVVDGYNGFLVAIKSTDELEQAMLRFIRQPELIERMGDKSRKLAEKKFNVHKVNANMLQAMGIT